MPTFGNILWPVFDKSSGQTDGRRSIHVRFVSIEIRNTETELSCKNYHCTYPAGKTMRGFEFPTNQRTKSKKSILLFKYGSTPLKTYHEISPLHTCWGDLISIFTCKKMTALYLPPPATPNILVCKIYETSETSIWTPEVIMARSK